MVMGPRRDTTMMWPGPAYLRDMMTPRRWPSRRLTVHCALSLSFGSPPLKAGRKEPVLVQGRARARQHGHGGRNLPVQDDGKPASPLSRSI